MTNPMIRIHDLKTNEVIDREMTKAEFEEFQNPSYLKNPDYIKQKTFEEAKTAAREAILDRLGLTIEEAALLLG